MRRHAVHDGVRDEDPAEIVRDEPQWRAIGAGQAAGRERFVEQRADYRGGQWPVLGADPSLEQQRQRRVEDPFVVVVGRDQRDRPGVVTDPADNGGQHVGEFGADDQQPLGVGLRGHDVQQRDEFAGRRQPVLDQAGVGDLGQLLDTQAGVTQKFDHGPRPEGMPLFLGEVAAPAAGRVLGPDLADVGTGGRDPAQGLPVDGEQLARVRRGRGGQPGGRRGAGDVHERDEGR